MLASKKNLEKCILFFFLKSKNSVGGSLIQLINKTFIQKMSLTSGVSGREMMKEKCGEQTPFKCISKGKIEIFELENLRTFLLNVQYTELFILRS